MDVERVSKRFVHRVKGEVYAARDVTLRVQPGEFLTLLGPSGCGKTTTLRMIAGFERPDAGQIRFDGQDVTHIPANRRNIGFVFQNYALFPHLSIFENVAYGLRVRGESSDSITRAVGDVLALVGLAGQEQQFPAQLSGGEQQRVALARAIVIRPRVLLREVGSPSLAHRFNQLSKWFPPRQPGLSRCQVSNSFGGTTFTSARIAVLGREVVTHVASGHLKTGESVQVALRPEAVEMTRPRNGDAIHATVQSSTFLGDKIEYVVDCDGHALQIARYNAGPALPLPNGTAVTLAFADDAAVVLPREPQSGNVE